MFCLNMGQRSLSFHDDDPKTVSGFIDSTRHKAVDIKGHTVTRDVVFGGKFEQR